MIEEKTGLRLNGKPFTVKAFELDRGKSDSGIELYSTYKISLMLTDGLAAVVGDRVFQTTAGDLLFFRPDEVHFGRFLHPGRYSFIDFYLPADFFADFPGGENGIGAFLTDRSPGRTNLIRPPYSSAVRLAEAGKEVAAGIRRDLPLDRAKISLLLLETLVLCAERYGEQKKAPASGEIPPVVRRALRYIGENYAGEVSLSAIAAACGCGVSYLSRVFRGQTGTSVYRYLKDYRLTAAKALLRSGKNVTQACYESGFSDCSGFIRAFREKTGKTPLQYQKSPGD